MLGTNQECNLRGTIITKTWRGWITSSIIFYRVGISVPLSTFHRNDCTYHLFLCRCAAAQCSMENTRANSDHAWCSFISVFGLEPVFKATLFIFGISIFVLPANTFSFLSTVLYLFLSEIFIHLRHIAPQEHVSVAELHHWMTCTLGGLADYVAGCPSAVGVFYCFRYVLFESRHFAFL